MSEDLFHPADFMNIGIPLIYRWNDECGASTQIDVEALAKVIADEANRVFKAMHKCEPQIQAGVQDE